MDGLIRVITQKGNCASSERGNDLILPAGELWDRDVAQGVYLFLEEVASKPYVGQETRTRENMLGASARQYAHRIHEGDDFETAVQTKISAENLTPLMLTVDSVDMEVTMTQQGAKEALLSVDDSKRYANNPEKYASSSCLPEWGRKSIRIYQSLGVLVTQGFSIGYDPEFGLLKPEVLHAR